MTDGLAPSGLSIVCETCESDIDFADDSAELGICRQCGLAFFVETATDRATQAS
jgi:hypothetical protein